MKVTKDKASNKLIKSKVQIAAAICSVVWQKMENHSELLQQVLCI